MSCTNVCPFLTKFGSPGPGRRRTAENDCGGEYRGSAEAQGTILGQLGQQRARARCPTTGPVRRRDYLGISTGRLSAPG